MQFFRPNNLEEALQLLSGQDDITRIVAGGTDLLVAVRQPSFAWPTRLIDISRLGDLRQITDSGDEINIGAMVTHDEIVHHPLILQYAPLLAVACRKIGSQQIRNRGTIGGNICNASPCADAVTALVALEAETEICSHNEIRRTPLTQLILKPYHTTLESDELLTMVRIPKQSRDAGYAFYKLGRRQAVAISRINVATTMHLDKKGKIKKLTLAPGSVFPGWRRLSAIERDLTGRQADPGLFLEAGKLAAAEMIRVSGRRWSTPYKEPVVAALVKRALMRAAGMKLDEMTDLN